MKQTTDVMTKNILYIHGMGGGPHDGIGSGLEAATVGRVFTDSEGDRFSIRVHAHLYSFDPQEGHRQILSWVDKYKPDLIVATSLGAFHSLDIHGIPHVYVSPAFNAGTAISMIAEQMRRNPILKMSLMQQLGSTRPGCQELIADPALLRRYGDLADSIFSGRRHFNDAPCYGFFGSDDSYIQMGVVSTKLWEQLLGSDSYMVVKGADHNFSGFDITGIILPKVLELIGATERD